MFRGNSAEVCPARCATTSLESSAETCQAKNAGMSLANNARTCQGRSVGTFQSRNAQMCLVKNAEMYLDSSASKCLSRSAVPANQTTDEMLTTATMCLTSIQLKPMIFRQYQCIYMYLNLPDIYGILVNLEASEEINEKQ